MDNRKVKGWFIPFCIGGFSGALATAVIQPLDTLKVQIQVISEQVGKARALSLMEIISKISSQKGLSVLYRGLESAILRQIFYASARIGAYESSVRYFESSFQRKSTSLEKVALSMLSGAFGALVGNPFDVALIRRQASISNNKNQYRSTWHAFKSIIQKEGVLDLWRGLNITVWRVIFINLGQLAGKDIIGDHLKQFGLTGCYQQNMTALLASLLTATVSLPIDNIKVKLQKQDKTLTNYTGIGDCLVKSVRRQGILRLWVGLPIYFIRGTPHSFILLRTQQFLNDRWTKSRRNKQ